MRSRNSQGSLIYRDEDIDPIRCKSEFSIAAVEDLDRLGIRWDVGPFRQSDRIPIYLKALEKLALKGCIYPCQYSRKEISLNASSRLSPEGEPIFPVCLRAEINDLEFPLNQGINWRFRVPEAQNVSFNDTHKGLQSFTTLKDFGDFLVWRKDGMPAYELAVVVDDADMGITEIVRGEDLLVSTARQILVYNALGLTAPEFYHVGLVKDENGDRLAKQKHSLALRTLYAQGHTLESLQRMWAKQS